MTVTREPLRPEAVAAAHPCPIPSCHLLCSTGHVVCRRHWLRIPRTSRELLSEAFRARAWLPEVYEDAVALTRVLAAQYEETL